jgi:hypothetical protein
VRTLVVVLALLVASVCEAQIRRMEVFTGSATPVWTKIEKATSGQKITMLEVSNESTTSTDTLKIAFGNDTTSANIFPLRVYNSTGASVFFSNVYLDKVYIKSSGTVPYIVRIH